MNQKDLYAYKRDEQVHNTCPPLNITKSDSGDSAMSDDKIIISAIFLKRINHRIQELSKFCDELSISAFYLRQLCDELKEASQ